MRTNKHKLVVGLCGPICVSGMLMGVSTSAVADHHSVEINVSEGNEATKTVKCDIPVDEHLMGHKLEVRNYPIEDFEVAVHTYPEAFDDNNKRCAWDALGGSEDGEVLDDTTTECEEGEKCIDISTVNYIMSEAPCIWPVEGFYAVVGVCWNATNRGLYFTQKTVHKVRFYFLVEASFGTYGLDSSSWCWTKRCREGRKLYGWTQCRNAVRENFPWQGSEPTTDEKMAVSSNPRIGLYHEYYGEVARARNINLNPDERWFNYLQDLVNLQIDERLPKFDAKKRNRILAIHESMFQKMGKRKFASPDKGDQYQQELNTFFNEELDKYKTVFTDAEYETFFDKKGPGSNYI